MPGFVNQGAAENSGFNPEGGATADVIGLETKNNTTKSLQPVRIKTVMCDRVLEKAKTCTMKTA